MIRLLAASKVRSLVLCLLLVRPHVYQLLPTTLVTWNEVGADNLAMRSGQDKGQPAGKGIEESRKRSETQLSTTDDDQLGTDGGLTFSAHLCWLLRVFSQCSLSHYPIVISVYFDYRNSILLDSVLVWLSVSCFLKLFCFLHSPFSSTGW